MRSTPLSKYVPALASWEPLDANDGRSFGFALLQARLRAEGWHLMYHNAVDHVLADLGTARPSVHRPRGPAYERARPDELWHR